MRISDILKSKGSQVYTINMEQSIQETIQSLVMHNIGALLVLDDQEKLVGIISERDILRKNANQTVILKDTKVKDVMTSNLIIGVPNDDIEYIMGIMTKNRIRHLPVLDEEKVVGIVSLGDVVKAQLTEKEYDNRYLKQYMFGH
ncbi:MAG: CBS domain-containing protein [bacterium]